MPECDCHLEAKTKDDRRTLAIALGLNAAMFIVDLVGGILGGSSGLIADSLDMLADASVYGIGLVAIDRTLVFKANAARVSGLVLLALGVGAVLDVVRRGVFGSEPMGSVMFGIALLALAVNATVLRLLSKHRAGEVHLRATWISTRADVVANAGVIAAGILVMLTGSRLPDLVVGFGIGTYVVKEAMEILREAREALEHEATTSRAVGP